MLFHNNFYLKSISIFTVISLFFCFISSPILATDWDKIKRDGDKVIDNFYREFGEDSYVEQLKNIFYPKLSEKNKKEPIPIEKIMREAKAQIEAAGEKATEEKVQKKLIELVLVKVFSPLTLKLDRIMLDNKIYYKDISKNVNYPQGSSELLRVLGYSLGATIVSTAILSVIVVIKISCTSLTTYLVAAVSAWWAGTSIAGATLGATASSVILGPWGIGTLLVVGGITTIFYIISKMKEAEDNRAKAFEELKTAIKNSEEKVRIQWLSSIFELSGKDKDKYNNYKYENNHNENNYIYNPNNSIDNQTFTYCSGENLYKRKYILFKIKTDDLNSQCKICIYRKGIRVFSFDYKELTQINDCYQYRWFLEDRLGKIVNSGTYEARIEEGNQIKDILKFVVIR